MQHKHENKFLITLRTNTDRKNFTCNLFEWRNTDKIYERSA